MNRAFLSAIVAATLGLLLILYLIFREVGAESEGPEKGALAGVAVLAVVMGNWQAIAHLPGGGGH